MLLMYISLLANASTTSHMVFTIMFTAGRVFHTFSYELKLQPHRAIGWFAAFVAMIGFGVIAIMGVMKI